MALNKDINEGLLMDVLSIYSEAELLIAKKVAKRLSKGITQEGWNEQKLGEVTALKKEVTGILNDAGKMAKSKVGKGIMSAYKHGINKAELDIGKPLTAMKDLNIPPSLQNLILSSNNLMNDSYVQILRNVEDDYRKVITNASAMVLSGTETRLQATQRSLNEFSDKGITSFIDKAGRNWSLSSYSEMAIRTSTSHAAIQGQLDRQVELGHDLVCVTRKGTTCQLCAPWQNVVLSISGQTPGYRTVEQAREAGLFHPNCKHDLVDYDPELSDFGQVELNEPSQYSNQVNKYNQTQRQRANEREIRRWKMREAVAITPESKAKANEKVKYWQMRNLLHCEKHNLDRKYYREAVRTGHKGVTNDLFIGGNLKEYEDVFTKVLGQDPAEVHSTFMKFNLQKFADSSAVKLSGTDYEKWLKEEIHDLSDLDLDIIYMKDPGNKGVTPTSLYKKYIGDNPAQDYALISQYGKGTSEYKSDYGKWLKQQVNEIGTGYKLKPQYKEVIKQIDPADQGLSATELYKKYFGETPTTAFKGIHGYMDKGQYSKWLTGEIKKLKDGQITETVPFDNVVLDKTKKTIAKANDVVLSAKQASKLQEYKEHLDDWVTGPYSATKEMASSLEEVKNNPTSKNIELYKQKYELAKQKDVSILEEYLENASLSDMLDKKDSLLTSIKLKGVNGNLSDEAIEHLENKVKVVDEHIAKQQEIKAKAQSKAKAIATKKSGIKAPVSIKQITDGEADKLVAEITTIPNKSFEIHLQKTEECIKHLEQADGEAIKKYSKMWKEDLEKIKASGNENRLNDLQEKLKWNIDSTDFYENDELRPIYAAYDYTRASGVYNRYKWGIEDHYGVTTGLHPKGTGQSNYEYGKAMSQEFDKVFDRIDPVEESFTAKRLLQRDGLAPMLGCEDTEESILEALDKINDAKGNVVISNTGFTSTSTYKEGSWSGRVGIVTRVNEGTKAVYAEAFSHYQRGSELETLLKSNQQMRVIKAIKNGDPDFEGVRKRMGWVGGDGKDYILICETIPD